MNRGVLQGVIVAMALMLSLIVEILEGEKLAKSGDFPHVVQLSSSETGRVFCVGSILAPSVVITAAHCVYLKELVKLYLDKETLVTAGTFGKDFEGSVEGTTQIRTVARYVFHPDFNLGNWFPLENDIALLILDKPLTYTDKVKGIQLPPSNAVYSKGTLSGWKWGVPDKNLSESNFKKFNLALLNTTTCKRDSVNMRKWVNISELHRCGKSEEESGFCLGYFGGSLICQSTVASLQNTTNATSLPSTAPTICGIHSWQMSNRRCGDPSTIHVFMDVSKYLDWIEEAAKANVADAYAIKKYQRFWWGVGVVLIAAIFALIKISLPFIDEIVESISETGVDNNNNPN